MKPVRVIDLGTVPYREGLDLQRRLCRARQSSLDEDVLLLTEHPDVITLGRGTRASSLPLDEAALRARGYDVVEVERGGDVTYHGPGQLVAYPIFDLAEHRQDLHWYLRQLEAVIIEALAASGVRGERVEGRTGVWTGGRKIASIGVHVKRWVTFHGFALNVTTDLTRFESIVPCGIDGVVMTSVARERGGAVPGLRSAVQHEVVEAVGRTFRRNPVRGSRADLEPSCL